MAEIIGTSGDDNLSGTPGADNITALQGNDTVAIELGDSADGGTGTDTLTISLVNATGEFSLDLAPIAGGSPIMLGGGTIQGFERLAAIIGSSYSDYITTVTQAVMLTIDAGDGNDNVYGSGSTVVFNAGNGNDWFTSGMAADVYNGGDGIDSISYFSINAGGTLTMGLNPGDVGIGFGGDQLIDVERVIASAWFAINDTITGSNADNYIMAYGGDDTIFGMGGNDSLQGWDGNDHIEGGTGDDLLRGDGGADVLIGGTDSDVYFYSDGQTPLEDQIIELVGDAGMDVLRIDPNGAAPVSDEAFVGIRNVEIAELRTLANQTGFEFVLAAQFQAAGFSRLVAGGDIDASAITTNLDIVIASPNLRGITVLAGSGNDSFSDDRATYPLGFGDTSTSSTVLDGGAGFDTLFWRGGGLSDVNYLGAPFLLHGIEQITLVAGRNSLAVANGPDIAGTNFGATITLTDNLIDLDAGMMVDGTALRGDVVVRLGADNELGGTGGNADTIQHEYLLVYANSLSGGRWVTATGGAGDDGMFGGSGHDTLDGGTSGNDQLDGQGGDDILIGGSGKDNLTGGSGSDSFVYRAATDSLAGTAAYDVIFGFEHETDRFDLYQIDADAIQAGHQKFSFIGGAAFGSVAGQLRYSGGILAADTNGDGQADFEILVGSNITITANDLNLDAMTLTGGTGNNRLHLGSANTGASVSGGAGIDTLAVSGVATVASLVSIEALAFTAGSTLTLTGYQLNAGLAFDATISGTGNLIINMSTGETFSAGQMTFGTNVALTVNGTSGTDVVKAALGTAITVNGGNGADQIRTSNLADIINGGDGNDKILGLGGADVLTGGAGNDQFRYLFASDSGIGAAADRITDFVIGADRLNFGLLDTNPGAPGLQTFAFVGTSAFSGGGAAQLRYLGSGSDLIVQADVNGDGAADMEVVLQGLNGQTLTSAQFMLGTPGQEPLSAKDAAPAVMDPLFDAATLPAQDLAGSDPLLTVSFADQGLERWSTPHWDWLPLG